MAKGDYHAFCKETPVICQNRNKRSKIETQLEK